MNYKQAVEVAHANGESVIPAVCGMCGPGAGRVAVAAIMALRTLFYPGKGKY